MSSFLPRQPSTGPQSSGSAAQTGEHLRQQLARECLAGCLNLPRRRMGSYPFLFQKGSFHTSLNLILGKLMERITAQVDGHLHNCNSRMQISTLPTNGGGWFPAFLKRFKAKQLIIVPIKYKKTFIHVCTCAHTRTKENSRTG